MGSGCGEIFSLWPLFYALDNAQQIRQFLGISGPRAVYMVLAPFRRHDLVISRWRGSVVGPLESPAFFMPRSCTLPFRLSPHSDFDHKKSSCAGSIGTPIFAEMAGARGARRR